MGWYNGPLNILATLVMEELKGSFQKFPAFFSSF